MSLPQPWYGNAEEVQYPGDRLQLSWISDTIEMRVLDYHGASGRLEATSSGYMLWDVEVKRSYSIDTVYTEDLNTGEMTPTVGERECWMPDGRFRRFHRNGQLLLEGELHGCIPNGGWREFDLSGVLIRTYELCGGLYCGEYREFYPNGQVMWKGQFGQVVKRSQVESLMTGELEWVSQTVFDKVGVWDHYLSNGDLLERVTYEWMLK